MQAFGLRENARRHSYAMQMDRVQQRSGTHIQSVIGSVSAVLFNVKSVRAFAPIRIRIYTSIIKMGMDK